MGTIEKLNTRRRELLDELAGLEQIRRGTVTEQYVETVSKDGSKGRRGPYYLYTFKDKGKTVSRRLTDSETAKVYRGQIQAHRRFREVVSELLAVSEQLSDLGAVEIGAVKKTLKSRSRKKKK